MSALSSLSGTGGATCRRRNLGIDEQVIRLVDLLVEVNLVAQQLVDLNDTFVDDHSCDFAGEVGSEYLVDLGVNMVSDKVLAILWLTQGIVRRHISLGEVDRDGGSFGLRSLCRCLHGAGRTPVGERCGHGRRRLRLRLRLGHRLLGSSK